MFLVGFLGMAWAFFQFHSIEVTDSNDPQQQFQLLMAQAGSTGFFALWWIVLIVSWTLAILFFVIGLLKREPVEFQSRF